VSLPAEGIEPESASVRPVFDRLSSAAARKTQPAAAVRPCVSVSTGQARYGGGSEAFPAFARFLYASRYLLRSNMPGAGVGGKSAN